MRLRTFTATAAAAALLVPVPAYAERVTKPDPEPECSQGPPLDVRRATFDYREKQFIFRVKMGNLKKKHTRVIARYTLSKDDEPTYDVLLETKFVKGKKRVFGHWSDYEADDQWNRFTKGVRARWDFDKNVIRFRLTKHLRGKRVDAWAYSVPKGAFHGPECGDYIWSGRLNRG